MLLAQQPAILVVFLKYTDNLQVDWSSTKSRLFHSNKILFLSFEQLIIDFTMIFVFKKGMLNENVQTVL